MIRISGPGALPIIAKIFKGVRPPAPRRATFGTIHEAGEPIDQVLLTTFQAPASFTGEDMAEITCHGGILLAARILETVLRHGARAAEAGEFSQRAFFNGKIDLTRAEAIMDIIRARTAPALRAAALQLEGRLGKEILAMRDAVLEIVAHLEAWIDFPEEGIDPATGRSLLEKIHSALERIQSLLSTADEGRVLREGVRVAIVGRPNAGKSSLLNRLLGMDRAIVSEIPGTTRDTIEECACLRGILFRLTDTAGLRETSDPVEREGVARSGRAIDNADLVLHVFDTTAETPPRVSATREILVANKSDLTKDPTLHAGAIPVSSLTGSGFEALIDAMTNATGAKNLASGHSLAAINARHKVLLESAAECLRAAAGLVESQAPPEAGSMELRTALDSLGRIVGATDTEDILGEIFQILHRKIKLRQPFSSIQMTYFFLKTTASLLVVALLSSCALVNVKISRSLQSKPLPLNTDAGVVVSEAKKPHVSRERKIELLLEAIRETSEAKPGTELHRVNQAATTQLVEILAREKFQNCPVRISLSTQRTLDPREATLLIPSDAIRT
jgi:tRNA modification GTPase